MKTRTIRQDKCKIEPISRVCVHIGGLFLSEEAIPFVSINSPFHIIHEKVKGSKVRAYKILINSLCTHKHQIEFLKQTLSFDKEIC